MTSAIIKFFPFAIDQLIPRLDLFLRSRRQRLDEVVKLDHLAARVDDHRRHIELPVVVKVEMDVSVVASRPNQVMDFT